MHAYWYRQAFAPDTFEVLICVSTADVSRLFSYMLLPKVSARAPLVYNMAGQCNTHMSEQLCAPQTEFPLLQDPAHFYSYDRI